MTKLSDALRGAADRAPVSDVSIHADVTARRVVRQRGLRGAANGLVGVGAVTLLAFGIMAPGIGGSGSPNVPGTAGADGPGPGPGVFGPEFMDRMASGYGMCGVYHSDFAWGEPLVDLSAVVAGTEFDGGATATVTITTTALQDVSLHGDRPLVLVLWQGMVVAEMPWEDYEAFEITLAEGESSAATLDLPLSNCWDGSPLPGGAYEVLVSQTFFGSSSPIEPEPTGTPEPVEPIEPIEPAEPKPETDDWAYIGGSEIYFSLNANAGTIVVSGDVPEDPFEQYIPKQLTADDLPDNYLTPELARELFLAGVTNEPWSMAAGTSRWVMRDDSGETYQEDAWMRNYYGCSWDGTTGTTFPARSAELNLLELSAIIPSTINVSYGWVVDGNPLVDVTVRNTSDYAIPGFYGVPSAELYLVRDGRIVAEAWPAQIDRFGSGYGWDDYAYGGGLEAALASLGLLNPTESLSSQTLWREVNGCWNDRGGQDPVQPGTYTVLSVQSVYITSGFDNMYYGEPFYNEPAYEDGDVASSDMSIMPYPGWDDWSNYQYTDLQMWTSLGTVTITN